MDWKTPFVIYRISPEGKLEPVHVAPDIQKAKYWLTYIAQPGDVLCKTPLHPKHSKKASIPEYYSHRTESKTVVTNEEEWKSFAAGKKWDQQFPAPHPC